MSTSITGSKAGITVATMCAALMSVLDISIVNVALSDIRASFGTPLDRIAWVSTGYAMANVTIIPMSGWLQRKFGYKRYYAGSILLFTFASALCGLSWSLGSLVVFRILQGIGGGAIIPTSQAILFARYPEEEHGMAGALFGLGSITGPLLGPTIGGYLIDAASWHWIFLINVPVGLVAASLAYRHIHEPGFRPTRDPIDATGMVLLAVGMVTLQYTLEEGNREGWLDSRKIVFFGVVAAISLVTLIVHELEAEHPVIDLRVFADRGYAAATGLNFLTGTALFAGSFLYSLYAGTIMRYTALDIGLLFLKSSWIQLLLMPLAGRLIGKVDARYMVGVGLTGLCASLWLNGGLNQTADQHAMIMPLFVRACSLGLIFVPLSVVALSGVAPARRGNAAGLFNLTRELGGTIGLAWMSTALDRHVRGNVNVLTSHVSVLDPTTQEQLGMARGLMTGRVWDPQLGAAALLNGRIQQQALIHAFNQGFISLALVFALSFVLVFLLRRSRGPAPAGAH